MISVTYVVISYIGLAGIFFMLGYHKGGTDTFWKMKKEKYRGAARPGRNEDGMILPPRPWPEPRSVCPEKPTKAPTGSPPPPPPGPRQISASPPKEPKICKCHIEPEEPWPRE